MIETGLKNYYGNLCYEEINGNHYLSLGDWNEDRYIAISDELAAAIKKEFINGEKKMLDYLEV